MLSSVRLMFPLYFLLGSLFANSEPANDLPTLTWAKNDAAPFYYGDLQGGTNGFGDQMQKLLEAELPQYKHVSIQIPLRRLNRSWANNQDMCFSTMIYEDRAFPDYLLSIPNVYYEPHGIITRREFAESLDKKRNRVSLKYLLSIDDVRMGKIATRTFGPILDDILAKNESNVFPLERVGQSDIRGLIKMLAQNRFDYFIEYEYVFDYFKRETELTEGLVFIPIEEVKNSGVLGAVGCTRGQWGRAVIEDINVAITRIRNSEDYKNVLTKWLARKGDEKKYLKNYRRFVESYKYKPPKE